MADSQYLPFATNGLESNLDVLSPAEYEADEQRLIGNQTGIARRELVNTALRQVSTGISALAKFIADNQDNNVLDNGDIDAFKLQLEAALETLTRTFTASEATSTSDGSTNGVVKLASDVNQTSRDKACTPYGKNVIGTVTLESSGSVELDYSQNKDFIIQPTGSVTLSVTNLPSTVDTEHVRILKIVMGSTSQAITFPSSFKWYGGAAPTLSINKIHTITMLYNVGDSNIYCVHGEAS